VKRAAVRAASKAARRLLTGKSVTMAFDPT
jgi:hypothetical protein